MTHALEYVPTSHRIQQRHAIPPTYSAAYSPTLQWLRYCGSQPHSPPFERAKICASILRQLTIAHIHGNCRSFCQEQLHHIIESILPFLLFFQEQVLVIIEATLLWLTASLIGVSRFKFVVNVLADDDPPEFMSQLLHPANLVDLAV